MSEPIKDEEEIVENENPENHDMAEVSKTRIFIECKTDSFLIFIHLMFGIPFYIDSLTRMAI